MDSLGREPQETPEAHETSPGGAMDASHDASSSERLPFPFVAQSAEGESAFALEILFQQIPN